MDKIDDIVGTAEQYMDGAINIGEFHTHVASMIAQMNEDEAIELAHMLSKYGRLASEKKIE